LAKLLVKDYLTQEPVQSNEQSLKELTAREQEVLTLLADGESNVDIGDRLSISPKTVSRHRENIMRKLNLHSRTELVKYAIRKGIIQP
jgi:two-component system response regulator NreC